MEVYAHRGSRSGYMRTNFENTIDAFVHALEEQKCDGIECDLRMSKDGILLIHHDPMTRETNQIIRDMRFNDLRTPYVIPRLEEIFLLLKKTSTHCFLELKESGSVLLGKLILLMHEIRMHEWVTCIGFPEHTSALLHLAENHMIRVGLIPRNPYDVVRALNQPFRIIMLGWTSPKERNLFLRFSFLLPFVVRLIRHNHKEVIAGVINDRLDMQLFLNCGISHIITDNIPEALFLKNLLTKKQRKY